MLGRRAGPPVRLAGRASRRGRTAAPTTVGLDLPGTGVAAHGRDRARAGRARGRPRPAPRTARRGARADAGPADSSCERRSTGRARASRSRSASCSRPCCGREREIVVRAEGGVVQEVSYERPRAAPDRRARSTGPVERPWRRGCAHHARRLQSGRLGTYVAYLLALVLVVLAAAKLGIDRMSGAEAAAAGASSSSAASRSRRCSSGSSSTGRRGSRAAAGRRRCSRTASCAGSGARARSTVEGDGVVYRLAPVGRGGECRGRGAARAGCVGGPRSGRRPRRARARRSCSRSRASPSQSPRGTSRTASALMGASRDLTIAVFVEAALVLALAVAALVAGTTDLVRMVAGTAGTEASGRSRARARCGRVRARRRRRDGPPAGRQPRHAPRADDDPRGPAARVRGP